MENGNGMSISVIDSVNLTQAQNTLTKIAQFQALVQNQLNEGVDYGIIPGTGSKPTLLKPGAEKILMLMGLSSEFEVMDSTRDFENGMFQYLIRCKLSKDGVPIAEGVGSCNTKEKKYKNQDPYSVDNTILKMAKKRALIDATLLVGSLSQVWTQDLEDMRDINGHAPTQNQVTHDSTDTISTSQAKRMFALSKGNADLCKDVLKEYGYDKSDQVKKIDYDNICKKIEESA